jgi:phosphoribosylaminoimidazolecarboxamide formyltransferase/IMP cyclohydrolase
MQHRQIKSALISVYHKDGLEPLLDILSANEVTIYSTGGTQAHIEKLGHQVIPDETITGYPSILDGRVKTLHPAVFGGILARREPDHLAQLAEHKLPEIDLVVVDLYPFEETVANSTVESTIIEKIDIGGISLIRAAAKNYQDVAIVPNRDQYDILVKMLKEGKGALSLGQRRQLALRAFQESAHYDASIQQYFAQLVAADTDSDPSLTFSAKASGGQVLRYGENPHQKGTFYGSLEDNFEQLHGKAISYNNLVDIDAALGLMSEFEHSHPTVAILKHTNACGVATRATMVDAWHAALAADNVSAFGGILVFNKPMDKATAEEVHKLFCEVVLAPGFDEDALKILKKKKNRVLLNVKHFNRDTKQFKSMLGGVLEQDVDLKQVGTGDIEVMTTKAPTVAQLDDLYFANACAKHLKSNTIALVRNRQLLAMGCGQTSRVDALKQAIDKAGRFGFDLKGAVMASDAFFPFPDCIEIASEAGINAVIQPGGSIKDDLSIEAANKAGIAMVKTGTRHFKH